MKAIGLSVIVTDSSNSAQISENAYLILNLKNFQITGLGQKFNQLVDSEVTLSNLGVSNMGLAVYFPAKGIMQFWNGTAFVDAFGGINSGSGTLVITTGAIITSATANYDKVSKQVAISGSLTFATANTDVAINLPFAPDFGCSINIGNLTFTLNSGSTTASVKSSITGAQGFQINYKTA